MAHGFVSNGNARTITMPKTARRQRRGHCPLVLLAGPEAFTVQETLCIGDAIRSRQADVEVFRADSAFRITDFVQSLAGATWLLLAVGEYPGRELEMLRETQRLGKRSPKIGIICLAERVQTSHFKHEGGIVDLIVRRSPLDMSLSSFSRSHHMLLAEDLTTDQAANSIARAIIPTLPL